METILLSDLKTSIDDGHIYESVGNKKFFVSRYGKDQYVFLNEADQMVCDHFSMMLGIAKTLGIEAGCWREVVFEQVFADYLGHLQLTGGALPQSRPTEQDGTLREQG